MLLNQYVLYPKMADTDTVVTESKTTQRLQLELVPVAAMVGGMVVVLEFVPVSVYGRMEFLPLLLTSIGCAAGLIFSWIRLLVLMMSS